MRTASQNDEVVLRGGRSRVLPQPLQLQLTITGRTMRFGRDLDLGLEKFPANMPSNAKIGALKQCVRRPRSSLQRSRIGQKIFFLNAKLKQLVGHESAGMLPRWHHRTDA
jgi:hypothetical protein